MNTSFPPRREGVNPYVFVVGCPRSGTTLLQRMLDAHPDLAIANDTHFIPRALGNDDGSDLSAPVIDRVVSYKRFARLGIDEVTARQLGAGATTYSQYVSRLYDELATRRGKPYAGEKTPDYVRH